MERYEQRFVTRAAWAIIGFAVRHWERTEIRNGMLLPEAHLGEVATDLPPDEVTLEQRRQEFEDLLTASAPSLAEV